MTHSDTTELAHTLAQAAIEKLADDVKIIDLRGVVSYTDYFVVCTGQNQRLTKAIAEHVMDAVNDLGGPKKPRRRESDPDGTWLLLDYNDVVLHIFTPEARSFYRLESLWGQVPQEKIVDSASDSVTQQQSLR